ncbi:MAG: peptidylprolyl isomerase [Kangiellaceae bacterium]|nr:peptidylprolyl isomerase [Kangiellaceae bacterium]
MNKLIPLLATAFSLAWSSFTYAAEELDETIALVEKDVILKSELERKMNAVLKQLKKANQPLPPMNVLQSQVLERAILDSLQLQMAKRSGVRIGEQELNSAVADIAKKNNMNLEQLRQSVSSDGLEWELFREDLRDEIMITRVRRGMVSNRISISDQELDSMVSLIDAEGSQKIQYHLGHILIAIKDASDQASIQEARDEAIRLVKELRGGAEFANLAIRHSDGQEALQGGDFGWRSAQQLPTLFAGPAKILDIGGVTDPLRSGSGFHILKLLDKRGEQRHIVKQVKARHILLIPNTIRDNAASAELIKVLRQRILDGESFAELAKEYSDDKGTALQGGELSWNVPEGYVGPFKTAVETLPLNQLSEPVETQFGWHIIEVIGRRDADQTNDFKRQQAARVLQARKFDEEVETWLREIRDTSFVEVLIEDDKK